MVEQTGYVIDLLGLLRLFRRKILIIIGTVILCGVLAFAFSQFVMPQQYVATTRVYVMNRSENNGITSADFVLSNYLVSDIQVLITGQNVTDVVTEVLDLDMSQEELSGKIRVSAENNTRVLQISVTDPDAQRAAQIANCVRQVASEQIKSILDIDVVNLIYEAKVPKEPSSPDVVKNTVLGAAAGLILSMSILSVRFFLYDSFKGKEQTD